MHSNLDMVGSLGLRVYRGRQPVGPWRKRLSILAWHAKNWLRYRRAEIPFSLFLLFALPVLRLFIPALCVLHGRVRLRVVRGGEVWDYGTVGRHLIVTAGKNAVAGAFNNVAPEPELFKFHGFGTGTAAAAAGDTTLQTELTTQYAVDNTRPTGSQANLNNTYTTVGNLVPDSGGALAITEWGLFSANAAGTLFDRQVFAAVNLSAGVDSLQTTYVLTLS